MKNIIGKDKIKISKNAWALSLVMTYNEYFGHAFLVLEGLTNSGRRLIKIVELVNKENDDGKLDVTKADIIVKNYLTVACIASLRQREKIKKYKSITKTISKLQVEAFNKIVASFKREALFNRLNYITAGNPTCSRFFQASIEKTVPKISHNKSIELNYKLFNEHDVSIPKKLKLFAKLEKATAAVLYESIDSTLRHGHNCISFAKTVWKLVGLPYNESLLGKFVVRPEDELNAQINKRCLIM